MHTGWFDMLSELATINEIVLCGSEIWILVPLQSIYISECHSTIIIVNYLPSTLHG